MRQSTLSPLQTRRHERHGKVMRVTLPRQQLASSRSCLSLPVAVHRVAPGLAVHTARRGARGPGQGQRPGSRTGDGSRLYPATAKGQIHNRLVDARTTCMVLQGGEAHSPLTSTLQPHKQPTTLYFRSTSNWEGFQDLHWPSPQSDRTAPF